MVQVSPGIKVSEIDLTTTVASQPSSVGAIAGVFSWGPLNQAILIPDELTLAAKYGKPSNLNAETWFTAANFLSYQGAGSLLVSRASGSGNNQILSAIANTGSANVAAHVVRNADEYTSDVVNFSPNVEFIARYPGALGNSLKVSVCLNANQYSSNVVIAANTLIANTSGIGINIGSNTATVTFANTSTATVADTFVAATALVSSVAVGDYIQLGNSTIGTQYLKINSVTPVVNTLSGSTPTGNASFNIVFSDIYKLSRNYAASSFTRNWEYFNQVSGAPNISDYQVAYGNTAVNDEIHIVISDQDGLFTGNPGSVVDVYSNVSRATDAKLSNSQSNYYKNVINKLSSYVWAASDYANAISNTALNLTPATGNLPITTSFIGGTDGLGEGLTDVGNILQAYDKIKDKNVNVDLIMSGKSYGGILGEQVPNYIIDNISSVRADCVSFVSPPYSVSVNNNNGTNAQDTVGFRNLIRSTSYAIMDSGYKYQYDKYNDVYRWVPLNGDIAGLCAQVDFTNAPWFSPGGFNRGNIKNLIKLSFNPTKADRDLLYPAGINPVVTFPGQGTVLFGDKTLSAKSSAFDRINVRRLFVTVEKEISKSVSSFMFEFNDPFTRAQVVNQIDPYLRDIKGRRGVYDYVIVCDATNNTPEVVDSERLVISVFLKPAKAANFIELNFVGVSTGADFGAITGQQF